MGLEFKRKSQDREVSWGVISTGGGWHPGSGGSHLCNLYRRSKEENRNLNPGKHQHLKAGQRKRTKGRKWEGGARKGKKLQWSGWSSCKEPWRIAMGTPMKDPQIRTGCRRADSLICLENRLGNHKNNSIASRRNSLWEATNSKTTWCIWGTTSFLFWLELRKTGGWWELDHGGPWMLNYPRSYEEPLTIWSWRQYDVHWPSIS